MAQNIVASIESSGGSPELMRSPRSYQLIKLVGSSAAVNDTSNALPITFVTTPTIVIGWSGSYSVSGQSITFTALHAMGNATEYVLVANSI